MTSIARNTSLAVLGIVFAVAGIGCVQQDESHTNTAPPTDGSAPTPATATLTPTPATEGSAPAPATATPTPRPPASEEAARPASAVDDGVKLEKVTYNEFLKRIAANPSKAKYTMVDAWASWCGPCKENFPHLVEMSHKYADKGLAVVSMSFDDPAKSKQVDDAEAFLHEKKATCTNYLLDEEDLAGFEKFGVNAIPAVFVYGPDGKEVKRFTMDDPNNQFTYDQVEKEVAALLDGK